MGRFVVSLVALALWGSCSSPVELSGGAQSVPVAAVTETEAAGAESDSARTECGVEVVCTMQGIDLVRTCDRVPVARFPGAVHFEWGDVDGTEGPELVVLWAPESQPDRLRIWVIRLKPHGVEYLWRGSRMSGRVEAFATVHPGGRRSACLVTRETGSDGRISVVTYRWTGFGFGHGMQSLDESAVCGGNLWACQVSALPGKLDCIPEARPSVP